MREPDFRLIPHSRPLVDDDEAKSAAAVIRSGMFFGGPRVSEFEEGLRKTCSANAVGLFSSGRSALVAALSVLNLPRQSRVIVQTYVCDAVLWAIREAGLRPRFCDISDEWTASAANVASVMTSDCSAIVLAPPFGLVQSAREFRDFDLPIVHDLCQASPAVLGRYDKSRFGDIVVLSFHPTKYICAAGGGAAIDVSGRYIESLQMLSKARCESAPFSELQASIGCAQLDKLDSIEIRRSAIFASFIAAAPKASVVALENAIDVEQGLMFRFPLTTNQLKASEQFAAFAEQGVIVRHGVDNLSHRLASLDDTMFPNAVRALDHTVSVPFYPGLSANEVTKIIRSLQRIV